MFSRYYPEELHIGQRVLVWVDPTQHPVPAVITLIDIKNGVVHVNPVGYKVRWQAHPRTIRSTKGQFLHFDNNNFYYSDKPNVA